MNTPRKSFISTAKNKLKNITHNILMNIISYIIKEIDSESVKYVIDEIVKSKLKNGAGIIFRIAANNNDLEIKEYAIDAIVKNKNKNKNGAKIVSSGVDNNNVTETRKYPIANLSLSFLKVAFKSNDNDDLAVLESGLKSLANMKKNLKNSEGLFSENDIDKANKLLNRFITRDNIEKILNNTDDGDTIIEIFKEADEYKIFEQLDSNNNVTAVDVISKYVCEHNAE